MFAATTAAWAQTHTPTDRQVANLGALARAALPMATLEDGRPVPEETPDELAQPIISRALAVQVIRRGELSGLMDRCSLDWRQLSYVPLMSGLRAKGWSGKRMAYVGLLHGVSQGITQRAVAALPACSPREMEALTNEAASLVLETD